MAAMADRRRINGPTSATTTPVFLSTPEPAAAAVAPPKICTPARGPSRRRR